MSDRLRQIRAEIATLGVILDRYDGSEHEYREVESKYAKLFYRACDIENAVLAKPIASVADIIAKIRIIASRSRLAHDQADALERLEDQLREWRSARS
jgi:hypothetical protein